MLVKSLLEGWLSAPDLRVSMLSCCLHAGFFQRSSMNVVLFEEKRLEAKASSCVTGRSHGVKCERESPLDEHASPSFSPVSENVSKDTVTQLNPLVSLVLSQPPRGSAHRH